MESVEIIGLAVPPDQGSRPPRRGGLVFVGLFLAALVGGLVVWIGGPGNDSEAGGRSADDPVSDGPPPPAMDGDPDLPSDTTADPIPSVVGRRETDLPVATGAVGFPILEAPTGAALMLRSARSGSLFLIDADSGDVAALGLSGDPMLVTDHWLILWDDGQGWAVDLNDKNGSRRRLRITADLAPYAWERDGFLFMSSRIGAEFSVFSIPIGQWEKEAEPVVTIPRFPVVETPIYRRFDLISLPGTGVYELTPGSGFHRVGDGRLVATDGERSLVRECDEAFVCGNTWYARDGWKPLPGLSMRDDFTQMRILTGGEFVLSTGLGGVFLSELETGKEWDVRRLGLAFNDDALPVIPIGSGLVFQTALGDFQYYDLDTETATELPFDLDRSFELSVVVSRDFPLIDSRLADG